MTIMKSSLESYKYNKSIYKYNYININIKVFINIIIKSVLCFLTDKQFIINIGSLLVIINNYHDKDI